MVELRNVGGCCAVLRKVYGQYVELMKVEVAIQCRERYVVIM